MLDPPVDDVEIPDEHQVERRAGAHDLEPVARQVPLEEAAGLGLGIGNEERSGSHAIDGRRAAAARLVVQLRFVPANQRSCTAGLYRHYWASGWKWSSRSK